MYTDLKERLRIGNGRLLDISFYEDTGTTAKFFWDSSAESLGIGTSSPSSPLTVQSGSAGTVVASFKNSGFFGLTITPQVGGSGAVTDIGLGAGESLSFSPNNTEAMRIDSAGNVGIGTDSPADTQGGLDAAGAILARGGVAANQTSAGGFDMSGNALRIRSWGATAGSGVIDFRTGGGAGSVDSQAMRIDANGKLLVGTTHASLFDTSTQANAGALIDGVNDNVQIARWQGVPLYLNRMSTDGTIVDFRKSGTSVGSIQSRAGLVTSIILDPRTDGAGLTGTTNTIGPVDGAGTRVDNTINLASSAHRFKDLYLSGGAYLGGSAAANKLDDYEEGTFTPAFSITGATITHDIQTGRYTKIGNMVHFHILLGTDAATGTFATSNMLITGLPFAANNAISGPVGAQYGFATVLDNPKWLVADGTTTLSLFKSDNNNTQIKGDQFGTAVNKNRMYITGCYQTNS